MKKTYNVVPFRTKQGVTMTLAVFEPRDNEIWVKPIGAPDALQFIDFDGFNIDSRLGKAVRRMCSYVPSRELRRELVRVVNHIASEGPRTEHWVRTREFDCFYRSVNDIPQGTMCVVDWHEYDEDIEIDLEGGARFGPKKVNEAWVAYDYLLDEQLKDGFADEEEVDDWAAAEVRLQRSVTDPGIWKNGMAFCFNGQVDWDVAEQCKIPVAVLEGKEVLFLPGDYYSTLAKIIAYQGLTEGGISDVLVDRLCSRNMQQHIWTILGDDVFLKFLRLMSLQRILPTIFDA